MTPNQEPMTGPMLAVITSAEQSTPLLGLTDADLVRREAGLRGDRVETLLLAPGDSYEGILEKAAELHAGLLVLGPGDEWLDLTSRSGRLIRHTDLPVLIARQSPATGPIVVGTDFSDSSRPALVAALAEARARPAQIIVAHVVGAGAMPMGGDPTGAAMSAIDFDAVLEATQAQLHKLIADAGPDVEARVLTGGTSVSLIELAKQTAARLIVVGAHGRTGIGRLLIGSTAEAVARGASCSVLIVRLHPRHEDAAAKSA